MPVTARKLAGSCSTVLIAVALFAACGSSGSSKANPLSNNNGSNNSGNASGSSSDSFSKLVADAAKQKFKITYTDSDGKATTYAQDGTGNSVFGGSDSQIFYLKTGTVQCSTSGGTAECTSIPGSSSGSNPFAALFVGEQNYVSLLGGHFGHTSTKTIAGRDAQCVTISASDVPGAQLKGSATYCNDKKTGVLLEISGTDESGSTTNPIVVTKFETPSDADFTPPATPKTIPTIPGGG